MITTPSSADVLPYLYTCAWFLLLLVLFHQLFEFLSKLVKYPFMKFPHLWSPCGC